MTFVSSFNKGVQDGELLNNPKKKLVYYIPLNSEKQFSEDTILKIC